MGKYLRVFLATAVVSLVFAETTVAQDEGVRVVAGSDRATRLQNRLYQVYPRKTTSDFRQVGADARPVFLQPMTFDAL